MKYFQSPANVPDPPVGLGLRSPHLDEISATRPAVAFFEVHPENYILDRAGLGKLERLRMDYPLSLHAVGLSLGSSEGVSKEHLANLRDLIGRLDPFLVSDHLSWSMIGGVYLNDLLPLPYTKEAFDIFSRNVEEVQSALKRQILIENPSAYVRFRDNEFDEPEFLRMLVTRTGCGLLLDVNNVFVSATNLGFDAKTYLRAFPFEAVKEIHLAGHSRREVRGETILIDDHGSAVPASVLSLYSDVLARTPNAATLIEWDSEIPAFSVLVEQRDRAAQVAKTALAPKPAPGLEILQTELAKALLNATAETAGLGYTGHLSVYLNNVRESLTAALRTVYAGVEELVGPAFFRQTAWQFIAINPPRQPSLAGYGEEFPEFLDALPSCGGLPYLADVARFEWSTSRASLHAPHVPMSADDLKACTAKNPAQVVLTAQAGLSYMASTFPVDAISNFARAGGEGTPPKIDNDSVFLEIAPGQDGVIVRRLEEAEFRFREALFEGADIGAAADRALQADPLFVLVTALRSLLSDGIFTDCRIGQSQFEEIKSCPC